MLNLFEKLINEHGSSTILKERITAIKEEYTRLESERDSLKTEVNSLKSSITVKELLLTKLQEKLAEITNTIICDHCDSSKLKKVGVRNDPSFKLIPVKQFIYECLDCNKKTYVTVDE